MTNSFALIIEDDPNPGNIFERALQSTAFTTLPALIVTAGLYLTIVLKANNETVHLKTCQTFAVDKNHFSSNNIMKGASQ